MPSRRMSTSESCFPNHQWTKSVFHLFGFGCKYFPGKMRTLCFWRSLCLACRYLDAILKAFGNPVESPILRPWQPWQPWQVSSAAHVWCELLGVATLQYLLDRLNPAVPSWLNLKKKNSETPHFGSGRSTTSRKIGAKHPPIWLGPHPGSVRFESIWFACCGDTGWKPFGFD